MDHETIEQTLLDGSYHRTFLYKSFHTSFHAFKGEPATTLKPIKAVF